MLVAVLVGGMLVLNEVCGNNLNMVASSLDPALPSVARSRRAAARGTKVSRD